MKTVAFHNLGCKVNSYEMDAMLQELKAHGYKIVSFDEKADVYIVNTCTVTNIADRKSRQMLHKAKKMNPESIVVAVGCYVQSDTEGVRTDDAVDLMIGNNRKKDLVSILESYLEGVETESVIDINHTDEYEEMQIFGTQEHTRAYIKIQDGCNQFCTYCMIPYARGRVRSRKMEDILREIRGLVEAGYREFVMTGIHISSYGLDFLQKAGETRAIYGLETNYEFLKLLQAIDQIEGVDRLRLGSLEPRIVTEEFVQGIAKLNSICPHFHLSLQSGCEETLKRMNRHYTPEQFMDGVSLLRRYFEHPAITTDVIVGFPQETEEEFSKTEAFLREVKFYEMHVFKYSKRKGTKAAVMPNQVPEQIKTARSNVLLAMDEKDSREFREYYMDKKASVLLEETKKIQGELYWIGHTKEYVKVAIKTGDICQRLLPNGEYEKIILDDENGQNQIVTGIITDVLEKDILTMH